MDTERRITYWNRGAEAISGYAAADVIGHCCAENLLVHTDQTGCNLCVNGCPLTATFRDGACRQATIFLKHRDGFRVPISAKVYPILEDRVTLGAVEIFSDHTEKLAALERAAEMEKLALIDPLTSAGNRRYTEKVLKEQSDLFCRGGDSFAVLFFDIDRFKGVNDTYGHRAGDAVLCAVSQTIMNNLRSFDFLGRWGGDEFVGILTMADADRARAVAERCCRLVRSCQISDKGCVIGPTVSVGVAVIDEKESLGDVLARADANLYKAKQQGRNGVCGP